MTVGACGHPLTPPRRRWCSDTCQRDAARATRLQAVFNLTPADYAAILAEQGGGCAICGKPPAAGKALHIDHDHKSGLIRGGLCLPCNSRLVARHHDGVLLRRAAEYLDDPPARRALGRDVVAPGRPRRKRRSRRKAVKR